jgi:hypothetical protein
MAARAVVFRNAREMGVERTISKRLGGVYWSGRVKNWVTVKNPHLQRRLYGRDYRALICRCLIVKATRPRWLQLREERGLLSWRCTFSARHGYGRANTTRTTSQAQWFPRPPTIRPHQT